MDDSPNTSLGIEHGNFKYSLWPVLEDCDFDDMQFQQDGAKCHTAHTTMVLLQEKFPGRIISCNSEDCKDNILQCINEI